MNHIAEPEHVKAAERLRELYYTYNKSEDLINIGAYKRGTSKEIDKAIDYEPLITKFLKQGFTRKYLDRRQYRRTYVTWNGRRWLNESIQLPI